MWIESRDMVHENFSTRIKTAIEDECERQSVDVELLCTALQREDNITASPRCANPSTLTVEDVVLISQQLQLPAHIFLSEQRATS